MYKVYIVGCFTLYALTMLLQLRYVRVHTAAFGSENNHTCRRYCSILRLPLGSCTTIAEGIQPNGTAADNAGFLFALTKTKALRFFEKDPASQLKINNQHIEWQPQYNYLRVIIDKQLLFNKHVCSTMCVHCVSIDDFLKEPSE